MCICWPECLLRTCLQDCQGYCSGGAFVTEAVITRWMSFLNWRLPLLPNPLSTVSDITFVLKVGIWNPFAINFSPLPCYDRRGEAVPHQASHWMEGGKLDHVRHCRDLGMCLCSGMLSLASEWSPRACPEALLWVDNPSSQCSSGQGSHILHFSQLTSFLISKKGVGFD